jgi:hypothetical protein
MPDVFNRTIEAVENIRIDSVAVNIPYPLRVLPEI